MAALVESELAVKNVTISFAAPERFLPAGVTLLRHFFLYDVRENHDLQRIVGAEQKDGQFTRKRPPVRVDCLT